MKERRLNIKNEWLMNRSPYYASTNTINKAKTFLILVVSLHYSLNSPMRVTSPNDVIKVSKEGI